MSSYPPPDAAQWRIAVRFLTFGIMIAGMLAMMWWANRLSGHFEGQRQVMLEIQRDLLVAQAGIESSRVLLEANARRLVNVEERVGNASDDRRQMRETDRQLTEALVRLRALFDSVHDPQALRGEREDEAAARPRLQR